MFKLVNIRLYSILLFFIFNCQSIYGQIKFNELKDFIISTEEFINYTSNNKDKNCLRVSCDVMNFYFFTTLFDINNYQEFDKIVVKRTSRRVRNKKCDYIVFFSEKKEDVIFATILNMPKVDIYPKAYFGESLTFRIELDGSTIKSYKSIVMDNN